MDGSFRMLEHPGVRHEAMLRFPLSHCLLLAVLLGLPAMAAGSPPDRCCAGFQSRHPADPGGELLLLPRAGRQQASGRAAARRAGRGDRSRRDRAAGRRRQRARPADQLGRSRRADAAAEVESAAVARAEEAAGALDRRRGELRPRTGPSSRPSDRPMPAVQRDRVGAQPRSTVSCWRSSKRRDCRPRPRPTGRRSSGGCRST